MCVSHRRELGFEAVILKRVIIDNPEIRLAPIQNYDFHLALKIIRNTCLRSILSKPTFCLGGSSILRLSFQNV
jgi:hypothetical protein